MKMQLEEIARVLNVTVNAQAVTVTGVSFDTRSLQPGDLFVPLAGERDGHDFIESAAKAGAAATLVAADHAPLAVAIPQLVVADPLAALQALAKYYLTFKVNPQVVAITGSNGKTTTKDMTAAILASQYHVVKTPANFNNEIGVPLTILQMDANTEVLVVEMGMDRPGQLTALSQLAQPDVAVITMIGEAHIEFFKTRDRIADAKMEIVAGLKADGTLIYNGDEPLLTARAANVKQASTTFGFGADNPLVATSVEPGSTTTSFTTNAWPELTFELPVMGDYNVVNALAALAVGTHYQIKPKAMKAALANFQLTENRTEWLTGTAGEAILSDVYNANPTAMKLVLKNFAEVPTTGRRIAVLGDMLELGAASEALHVSVQSELNPASIAEVYLYGDEIKPLADTLAARYGSHLHYYPKAAQSALIEALTQTVTATDKVVLKASHGLHLEKVVAALTH